MSTYHKLEEHDVLYSVIHSSPRIIVASGSDGWKGNLDESGSLSLYEGVRSRRLEMLLDGINISPVDPIDTHSIDKVIFVTGSYPSTGSIRMVFARAEESPSTIFDSTQVDETHWYEEHFRPILSLFEYYGRTNPEYTTGSYDYYSLYLQENATGSTPHVLFTGESSDIVPSLFSIQAKIKPTLIDGSSGSLTIMSQESNWAFSVARNGKLLFTDYVVDIETTGSVGQDAIWQSVGLVIQPGSASFYINGRLAQALPYSVPPSSSTGSLAVGGRLLASGSLAASFVLPTLFYEAFPLFDDDNTPGFSVEDGFQGFIFDTRLWSGSLTAGEMSGSFNETLVDSGSVRLLHYARFNDGPFGEAHGYAQGSGAVDFGRFENHGTFVNVGTTLPRCPIWHPNDDPDFVTPKTLITNEVRRLKILHVPSMFYGRQIASGSIELVCHAYSNKGIVRVLRDDGRGRLYVSGSVTKPLSGEEYRGAVWNKVGNVFYSEGLIVLTDPSLLDFGELGLDSDYTDTLQATFDGNERTPTKVFMCRVAPAEANASMNPTFSEMNDDNGRKEIKTPKPVTYVTAVGLYNEDRKLVAVAKLAQPIRKREKDPLDIRLRIDL